MQLICGCVCDRAVDLCRAAAEEKLAAAIASIETAEVDILRLTKEADETRSQLSKLETESGTLSSLDAVPSLRP